jgi:hypothetical protein
MSSTIELSSRSGEVTEDGSSTITQEPLARQTEQDAAVTGISKARAVTIVGSVASVNFLNTMTSGILAVALPRMAKDLQLPPALLLW